MFSGEDFEFVDFFQEQIYFILTLRLSRQDYVLVMPSRRGSPVKSSGRCLAYLEVLSRLIELYVKTTRLPTASQAYLVDFLKV
ncbi:hypothetical protein JTE90_002929 [Oedothorax gibbosus]|uniref:Maturase K n=1 Tax=Oedothorax gibbosus TaxID=931172 RepID=A0AAV6UVT3_9ARAC|nr:hypothetical protein JTE90_002929 [Oedothorax gibbosus]